MTYNINIAGLERHLPLCPVTDDLYIAAFVLFGDAELTTACAEELLKRIPRDSYDYMITAEAKGIPLIHEMARQSGAERYFIADYYFLARKGSKVYMRDPVHVSVRSITTLRQQDLFLGADDCERMKGKRILIVDDVISTGESLHALEKLVKAAGGIVSGKAAILAEGDALNRADITVLGPLPVFNSDGTIKG